jgi:predicted Ser/Thr protein kinase
MSTMQICPKCLSAVPADAPQGACPKCLLNAGFESQSDLGAGAGPGFVPPPPQVLAKDFPQLEILEVLGAGGMGVVYKARQINLDRMVALKILAPHSDNDPAFAERFTREARALARLSHPNIVGIYDFGQSNGRYYFLMEFIDGVNLRQMIRAERLAPREALAIVPQVCDALQYAHDQGIVHRDIKPENLLVDRKGRVHIADFGLAKLVGGVPEARLTQSQHVMGTPHYMAPEQFEKPTEVDHRADIYSLGVVLYEMLTGELPLGRFAPPSSKVQIDVRLDEVVLKTLEKEPGRRYQQASEIKGEMETLAGIPIHHLPASMRTMFGSEFISRTKVGSWPLVHLAFGLDPKTGKQRAARGIIAIASGTATGALAMGTIARGIFAFGAMAFGVVAIGGFAFGLLTFAGVGIGLVFAYGGVAIGFTAFGGLALGYAAMGGWAGGYYAMGGVAKGAHVISGKLRDPLAREFFDQWAFLARPSIMFVSMAVFIIAQGIYFAAIFLVKRRVLSTSTDGPERAARANASIAPEQVLPARQVAGPAKALIAAALLNWIGLFAFAIFALYLGAASAEEMKAIAPLVIAILMAGSGLILFGALKMQRLESLAWARTAALLAMFIGPGYLIGWPAGIWSLVVLARPEVKRAFGPQQSKS